MQLTDPMRRALERLRDNGGEMASLDLLDIADDEALQTLLHENFIAEYTECRVEFTPAGRKALGEWNKAHATQ